LRAQTRTPIFIMPLTDTILSPELTQPQRSFAAGVDPRHDALLSVLLPAMERRDVRYRALQLRDGLLYGNDFVVDKKDESKLSAVFGDLRDAGFLAVQLLALESGARRVVFGRVANGEPETFVVDIFLRDLSSAPGSKVSRASRVRRSTGGATLVFLGPDGVGKTTLLRAVSKSLEAVFPEQNIYRWRPAVFARAPRLARLPHSKPSRSLWGSISYLFFTWLDFTSGYVLAIHSALSRSALVIFDRFYHDLLIDPKRYRFGGPIWMVRALARIVPPRDLLFVVLDADEQTILSRKQQLPAEEIRRQRRAYRAFAEQAPASVLVSTENPIEQCRAEALGRIFEYLSARLAERSPAWFGSTRFGSAGTKATLAIQNAARAERESPYPPTAVLVSAESLDCKTTLNSAPPQS
jgi:thymidylate kinase